MKLIGKKAFSESGVVEIPIPDGVEELCEGCFYECEKLSRVTSGESSSLKRIGNGVFQLTRLGCFSLPVSVHLHAWILISELQRFSLYLSRQ